MLEAVEVICIVRLLDEYLTDACCWRAYAGPVNHRGDSLWRAGDHGLNAAILSVANPASNIQTNCSFCSVMTKAHALHDPGDDEPPCLNHFTFIPGAAPLSGDTM